MKKSPLAGLFAILLFFGCKTETEQPAEIKVIPQPAEVVSIPGHYILKSTTGIFISRESGAQPEAEFLREVLSRYTGREFSIESSSRKGVGIHFEQADSKTVDLEGYELVIEKNRISIKAHTRAGYFYGIQTLLQLLPPEIYSREKPENELQIPCCTIRDFPRFPWRGMHLDVSRHFFPPEFIKRYIDLIAMHKMNVFHWHLTDDNGWRIEIRKYPELTEKAAWRVDREDEPWRDRTPPRPGEKADYGGFYSQDEIREIVGYAAERHITILPEIEMPGHSSEVFAAFPELSCRGEKLYVQPGSYWPNVDIFCAGKEETFEFLEGVLSEVFELFPSKYVHIGGDEATKTRWENCPRCQTRIRSEGLADEDELQSWFIRRMEKFLIAHGKRLIGWDEILEGGLAPDATVMSWRGMKGGIEAAEMGHDVIMCPTSSCYFDYYQAHPDFEPEAIGGFTTLKEVYHFDPVPVQLDPAQKKHILGGQGNLWTEYIATPEHAEYMALPRMTALAEVLWSPQDQRDWNGFQERLQLQKKRFDLLGLNYSKGSWKIELQPLFKEGVYLVSMYGEQYQKPIHYTLDGTVPDPTSTVYEHPVRIEGSTVITAALFENGQLMEYPSSLEVVFHLGTGRSVTLDHPPSSYYPAAGAESLVDGIFGSEDFHDGYWLGFEGSDFGALIDLEVVTTIDSVSIRFLQNSGSWIFIPGQISFELLSEQQKIVEKATVMPESTWEVKGTIIERLGCSFESSEARYIRITAPGIEKIPDWHEGSGNKGWLFADEAIILGPG